MKSVYFYLLIVLTLVSSCLQSLPPLEELEEDRGERFAIYNDTGLNHLPFCGEGTDLIFELTSGNEYKAINIPAGRSFLAAFKIEAGDNLRVTVKDAKTENSYTTQTQIINTDANKKITVNNLPLQ